MHPWATHLCAGGRWVTIVPTATSAPGNRKDSPLQRDARANIDVMAPAIDAGLYISMVSRDGVCECRSNRKGDLQSRHDPELDASRNLAVSHA